MDLTADPAMNPSDSAPAYLPGLPIETLGGIVPAAAPELARIARALAEFSDGVERRFAGLRKLMEVTNRIDPGALLDEAMELVRTSFARILPCTRVGLALLDDHAQHLELRWVRSDLALKLPAGYGAPLSGTSLAEYLESGEARILNDLPAYLALHPASEPTRLLLEEGLHASLTLPLLVSGRPFGFLFFACGRGGAYTPEQAASLRLLSHSLGVLLSKARIYEMVLKAQQESDRLLRNVLPEPIVRRLKAGEEVIADGIPEATVVFVDIVNFVRMASTLTPASVIIVLNRIFSAFDGLCEQYGVEKIKTIGDSYMLATGVPDPMKDHTAVAARIALDMQALAGRLGTREEGRMRFRIGIHTGPVVAGVIGTRKFSYDLWGDTVNIASRMESHGMPGRIHVTQAVYEHLREDFELEPRGPVRLKGLGEMETYFLNGIRPGAGLRGPRLWRHETWQQAGEGAAPESPSSRPATERRRPTT
jgi:class 3 adenylate cyclase